MTRTENATAYPEGLDGLTDPITPDDTERGSVRRRQALEDYPSTVIAAAKALEAETKAETCRNGCLPHMWQGRNAQGECRRCKRTRDTRYRDTSKGQQSRQRYEDSDYGRRTREAYDCGGRFVVDRARSIEQMAALGLSVMRDEPEPRPIKTPEPITPEQIANLVANFPERLPGVLARQRWQEDHEQTHLAGFTVWQRK